MGGNNSHSNEYGGVPPINRAYFEYAERILGHKILVSNQNIYHKSPVPMNSNTPNTTYICGHVDKKTGNVIVDSIACYKGHFVDKTVDIVMDSNGELVPYQVGKGTHQHNFFKDSEGKMGRVTHKQSNIQPVDVSLMPIVNKIVVFNNAKKPWKREQ